MRQQFRPPMLPTRRNPLDYQLAPEINEMEISVDELKLQQVVINLLSNAVMFTPDDGRVTVRATLAEK